MKYLKQILIILLVSFVGELLNYFFSLPIPGSIYGMIILFILLYCGVLKLSDVEDVGKFLLSIMPLMFIPSAVGIMSQFDSLKNLWLEIILVTILTTIITMVVTGVSSQLIIKLQKKKGKGKVK